MPVFVHLTPERNLRSIRRGGIVPARGDGAPGVFALPVTRSFAISHQWLRELRRTSGRSPIFGVYFRLRDDEPVRVGHFNRPHVEMTAAEAVALMMDAEGRDPARARKADEASRAVQKGRALPTSPEGFEVMVPRGIDPREILRVKALPQVVGWRYRPGANGTPPCACICCERGSFGIRKLLTRVEEEEAAGRTPRANLFGREEDSFRRVERMRKERGEP